MKTENKTGVVLFDEWFKNHFSNLSYMSIWLDPLAAFQTMGHSGDEPERIEFAEAWERRFGLQSHIPTNIENNGWYLMSYSNVRLLLRKMKAGAVAENFRLHIKQAVQLLDRMDTCWGTCDFQKKHVNEDTSILVRFDVNGLFGYPIVNDVCLPYFEGPLYISRAGEKFCISDNTGRFYFTLAGPQTVEFQRASAIFFTFPGDISKLKPEDYPIVMSWIFAGGEHNVLQTAFDAISHRDKVSYSNARRVLRLAMGTGLPRTS